ncbi:hypothetical protein [Streptomyces sp. NPDC059979]|uniref:hypothetical protein n=1 Tax=Streptomyces sp. NPDC059979 TaxID=3347021 RepID=UPI00368C9725
MIHLVAPQGGRKVTVHALGVDAALDRAFTPGDVSEFLRRAGLEDVDLSEDGPVRREGGGPEGWTGDAWRPRAQTTGCSQNRCAAETVP